MAYLKTNNNIISRIVSVVERLDSSAQKAVLSNLQKFEMLLKAQRLDASVKKSGKPSVEEIASVIRKVRKARAKEKA